MTESEKYAAIKDIWDDHSASTEDCIKCINEIIYHIETIKEEQ